MQCARNDLKPENVLVFYPDCADAGDKYPVGQWKIADFGISNIQQGKRRPSQSRVIIMNHIAVNERPRSSSLSPERTDRVSNATMAPDDSRSREYSISRTPAKGEPGKYTAPEVIACSHPQPDARRGDIWSFGCISIEVLAYSVAPGLVQESRKECEKPTYHNLRFYDVGTRIAKPSVISWLDRLDQRSCGNNPESKKWIEDCVRVIKTIFSPAEPRNRPEAKTTRNELQKVHEDRLNPTSEISPFIDCPEEVQQSPDGRGISFPVPRSRDRSPSKASNLSQNPELISEVPPTFQ